MHSRRNTFLSFCLLMLVASDAFACPGCFYNDVMDFWWLSAFERLFFVALIAFPRLDVVRVLVVFLIFEILRMFAWMLLPLYEILYFPTPINLFWLGYIVWDLRILAVPLFYFLGQIDYFRRPNSKPVTWLYALLLIPAITFGPWLFHLLFFLLGISMEDLMRNLREITLAGGASLVLIYLLWHLFVFCRGGRGGSRTAHDGRQGSQSYVTEEAE
ncbi:MAG: hypothetical protein ACOCVL_01875 [Candidatus Sumerlaeota bacterium]